MHARVSANSLLVGSLKDVRGDAYRADIDGLRALAVALVVAFHAFPAAVPGGFIGVDVFFVISGYLITGLILDRQAANRFSIKDFYVRRARRILPALAIVILATLVIGWFVLLPLPYERLGLHAVASALFFPNLVFWSEAGYFDVAARSKPLLHLWSLGVEEQFYLVWPLLLVALRRWKAPTAIVLCTISAVSLVYSSVAAFETPTAAFYSPLSRLWELGAGGILVTRRPLLPALASPLGLILIAGSAFALTPASPFPGLLAVVPVVGTVLVIATSSRALGWGPLVALGRISYPFYLWHWPLLSFVAIGNRESGIVNAGAVLVSAMLAWLTARFIENPIRFGGLRVRGAAISATAILAVSFGGALVFYSGGVPTREPAAIRPVLAAMKTDYRSARTMHCWIPDPMTFEHYERQCSDGDILMWGDSFSGVLATGLPKPYAQFTRDGCWPVLDVGSEICIKSNAAVVDEILRLKPRRVILYGFWMGTGAKWQSDTKLIEALRRTLRKLRSGVDDVVLIGSTPLWPPSLPEVVFKYWSDHGVLPDRLKPPEVNYRGTDEALRSIANSEGVRFVSLFDALCNADGCLTHTPASRSEMLMRDRGHMTLEGAAYVVQLLGLARASSLP
jgi:peptidoglycan/LPS O-acetylase OafA/YrhL